MTLRFQFSLRAMLAVTTVAAMLTRVLLLGAPLVAFLIAALACFPLAGLTIRSPVEGNLAIAFLVILVSLVTMTLLAATLGSA